MCNIFSCSDATENIRGISNSFCCKSFEYHRLPFNFHFHSYTVFNEEMHLLRHKFRKISNSFSVFIFTRNCIHIMYERRLFLFITDIQNFSKFRLPSVLKKVQHANLRLDFKCFYNNQQNFFIYLFNNHFNWWKLFYILFRVFITARYYYLLTHVCSFRRNWNIWFECYNSKRNALNEHYVKVKNFVLYIGKEKIIRWKPCH